MDSSDTPVEERPELTYAERYAEVDNDRTVFVGIMIGVTMFVIFQAFIVAAFQTPVISGETPLWQPLKFCGITQLVYAVPTLLFFFNRKCPQMTKGMVIVTAAVFVGGTLALIVT